MANYTFPLSQKGLLNDALQLLRRNNQAPHKGAPSLTEERLHFTHTLKIQEYNSGQAFLTMSYYER